MAPLVLLEKLQAHGIAVFTDAGQLKVAPSSRLSDEFRIAIRENKNTLLEWLGDGGIIELPHINAASELIIPSSAPRRYRYWQDGQPIIETLAELNAPPQVWLKYASTDESLHDNHSRNCEGEVKETPKGIIYCATCRRFTLKDEQARYEFEERSAIVEFDGGLSRDKAEEIALAEFQQNKPGGDCR